MVNLELYRVFYTVAKCGSITCAAEELYISQPAVSLAIKQLEAQLGGTLFNRTHKGVELSESGGKQIFPIVENALKLLESAEGKFAELKTTATGTVRICASDTVSTRFLIPFIKEYHAKYPDVNLSLINGTSAETIDALKNKRGDIGFVNLPIEESGVKLTDSVMRIHDTFVANDGFKELFSGVIPLKRLQDYPLLMLESSTSTQRAITAFTGSHGVQLQPEIEPASLELMLELAKNGLGIACIPREFAEREIKEGSLKEIKTDPQLPPRAICLALPENTAQSFAVKEFIKIITNKTNLKG